MTTEQTLAELTAKKKPWNRGNYKHGHASEGSRNPLYWRWAAMIARCHRVTDKSFPRYGAKGILVCERWHDFRNFHADMYASYLEHKKSNQQTTIERLDNTKGYSPDNCCWATTKVQNRNQAKSHFVTIGGKQKTVGEWAELSGINRDTIYSRIKSGWPTESLLNPTYQRPHHG